MIETLYFFFGGTLGIVVGLGYHVVKLGRRVVTLENDLDRVRMAAYELTTADSDNIRDLQDSLKATGIELSRNHLMERMRRRSLTPEQSMAEFEAVVARSDAAIRESRARYEENPDG